jgi:hypothetical protein
VKGDEGAALVRDAEEFMGTQKGESFVSRHRTLNGRERRRVGAGVDD